MNPSYRFVAMVVVLAPSLMTSCAPTPKVELAAAASLPNATVLGSATPSQKPPREFYYIKPGDTGVRIAARHDLSLRELQSLNPGVDWSRLKVGQAIRVTE